MNPEFQKMPEFKFCSVFTFSLVLLTPFKKAAASELLGSVSDVQQTGDVNNKIYKKKQALLLVDLSSE